QSNLLDKSTNCNFLFTLFDSFGEIFCDQSLGGLNGIYAAIGLAVLSFFSATCGTVMIWHSMRAGKKKKKEDKKGEKKGEKDEKKDEKKEGEGGEEEVEYVMVQDGKNEKLKVGDQAQPMQAKMEPSPPESLVRRDGKLAVVQAVPTDPAAPDEKTNPSLLPNDALPGGAATDA
ncbi:hypothetical protein PMAYCL1PPCAC_19361, partial [Pristionchus mayeri]